MVAVTVIVALGYEEVPSVVKPSVTVVVAIAVTVTVRVREVAIMVMPVQVRVAFYLMKVRWYNFFKLHQ